MEKKIYVTPQTQILHVGEEAVMASTSWTPDSGETWNKVTEGNPDGEVDPYTLYYSKSSHKSVWENWD